MAASGCRALFFGLESGSNNVLQLLQKNFTIELALRVICEARSYFPQVTVNLLYGFPFSTMDDFYATLLVGRKLLASDIKCRLALVSPLPATPLTDNYRKQLVFDATLCSPIVAGWHQKFSPETAVLEIIQRHPEVFSSFYHFRESQSAAKQELAERLFYNRNNQPRPCGHT